MNIMASNTSIGRGKKGSKFWMQTVVNLYDGIVLTKAIQSKDSNIGNINWLSPLLKDNYKELKTYEIPGISKEQLDFWPDKGPLWDGVGIDENGTIILVEAKANINETCTKCSASSPKSINQIKTSMKSVHNKISSSPYHEDIWFNKYYQMGNRITFLVKLKEKGFNVKLVLLNIVDDPTYIKTSEIQWNKHYEDVFTELLGCIDNPKDVITVNLKS